jgi:predicted ester cyclase
VIDDPARLAASWLRLWNGGYDLADSLIAPVFRLHAALLGGASTDDVADPGALVAWIDGMHRALDDLTFEIEVGPLVDGDRMALRWRAHGRYSGGFPGATAAPGTPIAFTGIDLLRVEDGRIAEYWLNSDVHVLLDQLAVRGA